MELRMICVCQIKANAGLPNLNTEDEALYAGGGVLGWVGGGGGGVLAGNVVFRYVSHTVLIDLSAFIELKFRLASLTFLFVSKKL